MLQIESITIEGIGGIKKLTVPFNQGLNLICGPNGIGKTTILECISGAFMSGDIRNIKKNALVEEGIVDVAIKHNGNSQRAKFSVKEFEPYKNNYGYGNTKLYAEVIVFKTHRDINYLAVESIKRDRTSNEYSIASQQGITGVQSNEIKEWFINRYLWSAHDNALNDTQRENFEMAKKIFNIIDESVKFSTVTPDTYDIIVQTPNGNIYYEYLSSGYKSILHFILGFIKEIEYRFKNPGLAFSKFEGIILIDEIDLHLHPQWQSKIYEVIKLLFPNAQIIATTHSPHIIQSAASGEVIVLTKSRDGEVFIKELPSMEYGFKGWTVEEILDDVMDLESSRSELYNSIIDEFKNGLDEENCEKVNVSYNKLEKMLNPKNPMLKLLKIQMAGME